MNQILKDTQKVGVGVAWNDARGNPAEVENPRFSVSDDTLLAVDVNPDNPYAGTVRALGPIGTGQVYQRVDSLVGEGEEELVATLDVQVVAGKAVVGAFTAGIPEEQELAQA